MSKLSVKINLQQVFEDSVVSLDDAFKDSIMTAKNEKLNKLLTWSNIFKETV